MYIFYFAKFFWCVYPIENLKKIGKRKQCRSTFRENQKQGKSRFPSRKMAVYANSTISAKNGQVGNYIQ